MAVKQTCGTFTESTIKTQDVEGVESVSDAAPYGRGTWEWDWDLSRLALGSSAEILFKLGVPYSRVGPVTSVYRVVLDPPKLNVGSFIVPVPISFAS